MFQNPFQQMAYNYMQNRFMPRSAAPAYMPGFYNQPYNTPAGLTVDELSEVMGHFWAEVKNGSRKVPEAMADGLCEVVNALVEERMKHHAEHGAEREMHHHYHEMLEKLRGVSGTMEKQRLMNEHFSNLTENEKKVLLYRANMKPMSQVARELGMSVEEYCAAKKNLPNKAN